MPSRKSPKTPKTDAPTPPTEPTAAEQEPNDPSATGYAIPPATGDTPVVVGVDMAGPEGDKHAERLVVHMTDLGHARALPEAPVGDVLRLDEVIYIPGSIEQFADEDGRTMRIVSIGGKLHKYPAPEPEPEPVEG